MDIPDAAAEPRPTSPSRGDGCSIVPAVPAGILRETRGFAAPHPLRVELA